MLSYTRISLTALTNAHFLKQNGAGFTNADSAGKLLRYTTRIVSKDASNDGFSWKNNAYNMLSIIDVGSPVTL